MAGETQLTVLEPLVNGLEENPITLEATDDTNGDWFINNGEEEVILVNDTAAPITATFVDVLDNDGRQLTSAEKDSVVPAGVALLSGLVRRGPFNPSVWNQKSGVEKGGILVSYSGAGLKVSVRKVRRASS